MERPAFIIYLAVLVAGLGYFLVDLESKWKKRSHSWAVSIGALPFGAVTAIAIHAYSDFNLHIPANFLLLSAAMAMGYSAACLEPCRTGDTLTYRMIRYPLNGKGGVLLAVLIALTAWSATWIVRHAIAEGLCQTVDNTTLNPETHPSIEKIRKAIDGIPGMRSTGSSSDWKPADRKGLRPRRFAPLNRRFL